MREGKKRRRGRESEEKRKGKEKVQIEGERGRKRNVKEQKDCNPIGEQIKLNSLIQLINTFLCVSRLEKRTNEEV